jgi:hypothetical protein
VAVAAGFEPARRLPAYTLSRRAPSSARAGHRPKSTSAARPVRRRGCGRLRGGRSCGGGGVITPAAARESNIPGAGRLKQMTFRHFAVRLSAMCIAVFLFTAASQWAGGRSEASLVHPPGRHSSALVRPAQLEGVLIASSRLSGSELEPRIARSRSLPIPLAAAGLGLLMAGLVSWHVSHTRVGSRSRACHHSTVGPRGPPLRFT